MFSIQKILVSLVLASLFGLVFILTYNGKVIEVGNSIFAASASRFEPDVFLNFDTSSRDLEIVVKNVGQAVIPVSNDLTVKGLPKGIFVRIVDSDGHSLTNYLTPYSFRSEMDSAIPEFIHLQPGQKIEAHAQLKDFLLEDFFPYMDRDVSKNLKNGGKFCAQFKAIVMGPTYTIEKETKPACMINLEQ